MKTTTAVKALAALAQETRLSIYRELVKAHEVQDGEGGLAVGILMKKLKVAPATLSFHLKELTNANLITSRRNGRSIIYKAKLKTMQGLIDHLLEDCCNGACGVTIVQSATQRASG